jgi:hypothetical protein
MSTEAQIKANQQNSQKSTGPKTAQGKAAVSQNAVKHGLFGSQAVVNGENQADFDLHRERLLAELSPVGVVESTLAERFVSLSWRLRRAERMQNQAIDVLIARDEPSPLTKQVQGLLPPHLRNLEPDPRGAGPELVLGRAVIKDCANYQVLVRLSLYERRIESSLFKTLNELRAVRAIRDIEQANGVEHQSGPEASLPTQQKGELKKQSQFVPAPMDVKSSVKGSYENSPRRKPRENKPKQSQFRRPTSPKVAGNIRCSSKVKGRLAFG